MGRGNMEVEPEERERRHTGRRLLVGMVVLSVVTALGAGGYVYETNKIPSAALLPVTPLPPELDQGGSGASSLICAEDTPGVCTPRNALVALGAGVTSTRVSLANISPAMREAVVGAEDQRFYSNDGCDAHGMIRAALVDVKNGAASQGGSGITQQTAGLLYQNASKAELQNGQPAVQLMYNLGAQIKTEKTPENTDGTDAMKFGQQMYECSLALGMARTYTKDEVLEKYLNAAYFGRDATGIGAAAEAYFGVAAKDLTLRQAVDLAGHLTGPTHGEMAFGVHLHPANPNAIVPCTDPSVTGRSKSKPMSAYACELQWLGDGDNRVINDMQIQGKITAAQADELRNTPLNLIPYQSKTSAANPNRATPIGANQYVNFVKAQAASILGLDDVGKLDNGGYKIYTTLDTRDQAAMNQTIHGAAYITNNPNLDAAAVSVRQDGAITAMVGSKNDNKATVNAAIGQLGGGSGRGAGSTNKAFFWAYALEHGWTLDQKLTIGSSVTIPGIHGWPPPGNGGCDRFIHSRPTPCQMTVEEGLAMSSNIMAETIVKQFGYKPEAADMNAFGVTVPKNYGPSIVLGAGQYSPLEEATGFNGLVANKGQAVASYAIRMIVQNGKVLYQQKPEALRRVVSPQAARLVSKALNAVTIYGTAGFEVATQSRTMNAPEGPSAVGLKTGTENDSLDEWASGSVCDDKVGTRTASFWAGNPKAEKSVGNSLSSRSMAALFSRWTQLKPHSTTPCDISQ